MSSKTQTFFFILLFTNQQRWMFQVKASPFFGYKKSLVVDMDWAENRISEFIYDKSTFSLQKKQKIHRQISFIKWRIGVRRMFGFEDICSSQPMKCHLTKWFFKCNRDRKYSCSWTFGGTNNRVERKKKKKKTGALKS